MITDSVEVPRPCPIAFSQMLKVSDQYFCNSCHKTIIDLRGKTRDEIVDICKTNTCGIFTEDQLPGQQKMNILKRLLFYSLTVWSILGFSVKPLSAQLPGAAKDSVSIVKKNKKIADCSVSESKTRKEVENKNRQPSTSNNKTRKIIGCPAF